MTLTAKGADVVKIIVNGSGASGIRTYHIDALDANQLIIEVINGGDIQNWTIHAPETDYFTHVLARIGVDNSSSFVCSFNWSCVMC